MNRAAFGLVVLSGAALAAAPGTADAQLSVQVGLHWEHSDDGWRARPREVVYYAPRHAVRVPPGHMPRAGYCRLWYPDRPPGKQPRARKCGQLLGMRHYDGAVILGAPDFRPDVRVVRWDDDDDDDDDRRSRGRGRGRRGR
mgnify:CR=1 FL=1